MTLFSYQSGFSISYFFNYFFFNHMKVEQFLLNKVDYKWCKNARASEHVICFLSSFLFLAHFLVGTLKFFIVHSSNTDTVRKFIHHEKSWKVLQHLNLFCIHDETTTSVVTLIILNKIAMKFIINMNSFKETCKQIVSYFKRKDNNSSFSCETEK